MSSKVEIVLKKLSPGLRWPTLVTAEDKLPPSTPQEALSSPFPVASPPQKYQKLERSDSFGNTFFIPFLSSPLLTAPP